MDEEGKILLVDVDPSAWHETVNAFADHNYEQSYEFAVAMAKHAGATARFVRVQTSGRLIGAAAIRLKTIPLLGRGFAYITGGPLVQVRGEAWNSERHRAVLSTLKRELVEQGGHFLFARAPLAPPPPVDAEANFKKLGYRSTTRVRSYRTLLIDLAPDARALRTSLAGKWRTDLNFAHKAGLTVEHGSDRSLHTRFLKLFGEMHKAKNFDVQVDPRFIFGLPTDDTGLVVLIATKDGQDAAGHVLSLLGDTAVYLFGATNDLGRATKAGYLLNWQSMILAKECDLAWYDLGGIDPDANPGVYRFKSRMGGQELTAAGPYEACPAGVVASLANTLLSLRERLKAK